MKSGVVVVVPFFNGSAYLSKAVDSVLSQTVAPDEFIIVNDGSSEEESGWLHRFCDQASIRCVDKANGGQGSARNLGVAATSAPYICFLDQDDYFLPDHVEVLLGGMNGRRDFGWVYGDLSRADAQGNILMSRFLGTRAQHPKASVSEMIRHDMDVLPTASLIARAAFEAVGGFDEQFTGYEDDDLFLRLFQAGFSNSYIDRPVSVWRVNAGSTSYSPRMTLSRMRYVLKLAERFPDIEEVGLYFMRDAIAPRFSKQILKDARLAWQPGHPLWDQRAQIHELAGRCVERMLANRHVRGWQRHWILRRWLHARLVRAQAKLREGGVRPADWALR